MALVALWSLLAVTAACGSEEKRAASQPTATPTETATRAPLGRRDAPPAGVARQIDYFGVGDSPCPNVEAERPLVELDSRPLYQFQVAKRAAGQVEVGETLLICPRGFAFQEPMTVRVSGPAGGVDGLRPLAGATETEPVWFLPVEPALPRGPYQIEAVEGDTRVTKSLSVVAPRHRGVRVMTDEPAVPGTAIRLVGVGLPPSTRVAIDIYGGSGEHYEYVTSIPVATDGEGIGATSVPTSAADPQRLYLFHPRVPGPHDQDMDATLYVGK